VRIAHAPRKTTGWKRSFDDPIPLPEGSHTEWQVAIFWGEAAAGSQKSIHRQSDLKNHPSHWHGNASLSARSSVTSIGTSNVSGYLATKFLMITAY
jgi:hypothetical protein